MFPYEHQFSPSTYECGPGGAIKLHSLLSHLQEAAARHADALGVGMDWMRDHGIMWVLVNFRLDVKTFPSWEEETTIWTWPSGYDAIRAFREFSGRGPSGVDLFKASSDWLVLDVDRKMPMMLKDLRIEIPENGVRTFPEMVRLKERGGYAPASRIMVGMSSIDMNGHVNNTEYVRWGMDALAIKGVSPGQIGSIRITFNAEVFQGDELTIGHMDEEGIHHLRGERDGRAVFLMEAHTTGRFPSDRSGPSRTG